MGCKRLWLGACAIVLCVSAGAFAQTTQPTSTWPQVVDHLADALRTDHAKDLAPMIQSGPLMRTFGSDALVPSEKLLGVCGGTKALGTHAYLKSPTSLASDLSDDFKSADVPDAVQHDMVIMDAASEHAANEIAAKWIAQVLQPGPDEAVGVIVLWRRDRSDSFSSTASSHPIFVLVKADLVNDQYVLRQIVFGDPLEKKR